MRKITMAAVLVAAAAMLAACGTADANTSTGPTTTVPSYDPYESHEPPASEPAPEATEPETTEPETTEPSAAATCHPSYEGACLDPDAADYDCIGGSGNGPKYTGRVIVVGPDVFGLDRDGDGIGCE